MWVYEEEVEVDGEKRKLTEVINQRHENVKCPERGPARTRLFGGHQARVVYNSTLRKLWRIANDAKA